jgi:patatin-like phospholipase/acyl hydrolase
VVLAITKDNVDAPPTLFKTYDRSAAFDSSTLWQVARATSAATTFFKSIKVGRDEIEFIDAGFGYNNPCNILIQEAQREFPDRGKMRILSIGTGLGDVVTIQNKRLSIITALKKWPHHLRKWQQTSIIATAVTANTIGLTLIKAFRISHCQIGRKLVRYPRTPGTT